MEAGNECWLGGTVIIVTTFRTRNYGETDISRWGFKHAGVGAEGQSTKLAVCASLPKRNKDFLACCLPRLFTFLKLFFFCRFVTGNLICLVMSVLGTTQISSLSWLSILFEIR